MQEDNVDLCMKINLSVLCDVTLSEMNKYLFTPKQVINNKEETLFYTGQAW